MTTKNDLRTWILEALQELGGSGTVVEVCKVIWQRHEPDLRNSGDLFVSWQYDVRWAAQTLRDDGTLAPAGRGRTPWKLA